MVGNGRDSAAPTSPPVTAASRDILPDPLWENYSEEFRRLRTKIVNAFQGGKSKVIMVTSAAPQEGKTVFARNLARALAQASWKTLLLDADMRRPVLHRYFGRERAPGLADLLSGTAWEGLKKSTGIEFLDLIAAGNPGPDKKAITNSSYMPILMKEIRARWEGLEKSTGMDFLDLITAGTPGVNPTELIGSPYMPILMKEFRGRYEYVVIDSPPVLSIADTLLLGRYADGILMVVRNRVTPREIVRDAMEQLHDLPMMGAVLNGIERSHRYYGYY